LDEDVAAHIDDDAKPAAEITPRLVGEFLDP
jgi:hypothetical protein